jgi:hypothetical protein
VDDRGTLIYAVSELRKYTDKTANAIFLHVDLLPNTEQLVVDWKTEVWTPSGQKVLDTTTKHTYTCPNKGWGFILKADYDISQEEHVTVIFTITKLSYNKIAYTII